MKKFFYMAALAIVAALMLTACGDDEPKDKVTATAIYSMSFSQDLLDACNVFITYKAENGRNVMEAVNTPTWNKSVTSDKFPAEFGVMCNFGIKSESELNKDKYNLYCDFSFSSSTSKNANYSNKVVLFDEKDVAKKKVVSTLEKLNGKKKGYKVTENGIFSEADNLKFD